MRLSMSVRAVRPEWAEHVTSYLIYVLLVATLGPLLFGFHLAELNAPQHAITCNDLPKMPQRLSRSVPTCIPMTDLEFGLVTSLFTLGGLFGAILSGSFTSRYGRVSVMRYNSVFFILGPLAESLSPNIIILALGRFVSGLGAGTAVVVVPIYVAEIAPANARGFFGSLTQVMTCFGIVLTQLLGLFLSYGQMWRAILASGGAIGLVQSLGLFFAIESPQWTISRGDYVKAKRDLQRTQGHSKTLRNGSNASSESLLGTQAVVHEDSPSDDQDEASNASMRDERDQPQTPPISIFQVLVHSQWARPTYYVMIIMVAQQFAGINSIVFYGVTLLSDIFSTSSALINLLVSIFNLVVTILCAPLSDRLGRKTCLIASLFGMGISSLMLAVAILSSIAPLAVVAVFSFVGSFGLGLGPVPFILASELVGTEAVGATQSWALAANWTATFLVAQFFPVLNRSMGKGNIYFVFAGLSVIFAAFIITYIPETRGHKVPELLWPCHEVEDD